MSPLQSNNSTTSSTTTDCETSNCCSTVSTDNSATNGTANNGIDSDIDTACYNWEKLADSVLAGHAITYAEGEAILGAPDNQLLSILAASYKIRHRYFANTIQLYFLMNAKSGLCPEDCSYCSQSKISKAPIEKYNLLNREKIMAGAQEAVDRQSKTYCIVISARGPSEREIQAIEKMVPEIKEKHDLHICTSLGLLTDEQAIRLKACGVDRVNHNLNTGPTHYEKICTTHTFEDRINTLHSVRKAGMEICSGGIIGMGETTTDLVEMALKLRELEAESIPINFLNAIDGTPLEKQDDLSPSYCLKALALFRFANPSREIRISGGREIHLRSLQPLGLYPANSMFVGDYLTTDGQLPEQDYQMIKDLGFQITKNETYEV
ncbi:MAG: biotin synthase BioB [Pirellulaceae bacterium]|nr:biotin synthase BioB [Pirellulaceae bacterium]